MSNDKLLSQTISYLRFPLTVGVVFIHSDLSKGVQLPDTIYGLNSPDWFYYLMQLFSNVIPRIAVPLFFFISGFLFFHNMDFNGNTYKRKLYTRTRTLLIPYFLWNAMTLFIDSIKALPLFSSIAKSANNSEFHFSLTRLFNTFFNHERDNGILVVNIKDITEKIDFNSYPIDVPMWYVRDLMVMVLMAPIIYYLIKRMGKWTIISIAIIKYCIISILLPHGGYPSQFVTALFFFSWGAYFSIDKQNFAETMRKYYYAPFIYIPIAIIDMLTKNTDYNFYIHNLGILLGIVSAIIIASYFVEKKRVKINPTLANASFFIYALHGILLVPVAKVLIKIFHLPDTIFTMLSLYFVTPTITIILCLVIYIMLRKHVPSVWTLLTGGR